MYLNLQSKHEEIIMSNTIQNTKKKWHTPRIQKIAINSATAGGSAAGKEKGKHSDKRKS